MCGIFAALYDDSVFVYVQQIIDKIHPLISRRGHDWVEIRHYKIKGTKWSVGVIGCVLHLRGKLTPQPLHSDNKDWLLWNGEAYNIVESDGNDTSVMLTNLSSKSETKDIIQVLSNVQGPWSMIYFQEQSRSLWFGRDSLGRRSLVRHIDDHIIIISSIGVHLPSLYFHELSAIGLYQLPISDNITNLHEGLITCYPWRHEDVDVPFVLMAADEKTRLTTIPNLDKKLFLKMPFHQLNKSIPTHPTPGVEDALIEECSVKMLQLLEESVKRRVYDSWKGSENIGILYSGGLDSVVLAAIADRYVEMGKEIDLINVAFSNDSGYGYDVPDRLSAIRSLSELNSKRKWNLIMVNIDYRELQYYRHERIHQLIYPLTTVMDDSIGCALWFAARGNGILYDSDKDNMPQYQSNSKILLVGMGADEQFGGYSRHRTAFLKGGWSAVVDEVNHDICQISSRNLGRDDRCISDHHKEARYPYLDETFVDYVNSLPIWFKTDYTQDKGVGEKMLLRKVARLLGCNVASKMPKRAIQFGSRIAKTSGTSGHQSCGQNTFIS